MENNMKNTDQMKRSNNGNNHVVNQGNSKHGKKKKTNLWSNLLLVIGITGMLAGGFILGKTLWNEWNRGQLRKSYIDETYSALDAKIDRSAFNPQAGDRVGIIEIPSQEMTTPIIEGTRFDDLFAATGHEESTFWPGDGKQVFLTGHRNTDFGVLKHVQPGDEIIVKMPYGDFTYKITGTKIVEQTETYVIDPVTDFPKDQLVLMTCYPFTFGADTEHRFLVYAERV